MKIDHCRSCGKPIAWCKTEAGKRMPLDVDPVECGNILLDQKTMTATYHEDLILGYVSHFATCPQAKKWRKK